MNDLMAKFNEWKDWEVNVKGDFLSPDDGKYLDPELYLICAEQNTSFPTGTIWNDDYFWDNCEGVDRFLTWLKTGDVS